MKKNPGIIIKTFSLCKSIIKPRKLYIKLFNNELMCCGVCKIIYIKNYH
jgi:hypothetical protein